MTGPITFANPDARRQLTEQGIVVTFRKNRRTTGRTWWRAERTGMARGRVLVTQLYEGPVAMSHLETYADLSGFPHTVAWVDAIKQHHGEQIPTSGWLHLVVEDPEP